MRRSLALTIVSILVACGGHVRPRPTPTPTPTATPAPAPAPAPVPTPSTEVLLARARTLRASGDPDGARAELEAALVAAPDAVDARLELADLLVGDGRELVRAEALIAPLDDAGDGRVDLVRGRLAEARGDGEGASAAYEAALVAADDPEVRMRRALVLERLGRTDEEILELERLRAARPGDAFVRTHLADAYEAAGRLPEAEVELRWTAEAQPDRREGWLRLARFYERAGRRREALAAAERARAADGPRPERALRPLPASRN